MNINYEKTAEEFKPIISIKTLLIGEAPPPNGEKYFYKVPEKYRPIGTIENDCSLPGTVFQHYFGKRPIDEIEYLEFLKFLQEDGIFLIDIYNEPIKIRDKYVLKEGNLNIMFSDESLNALEKKIKQLCDSQTEIIFLLARNYQKRFKDKLTSKFREAKFIRWKKFRMTNANINLNTEQTHLNRV